MSSILIIDDERSIRNTMKDILGFEGHSVDVAENGTVGLALLAKGSYDLIFCDIKMPDIDGIEVLKRGLKEKPTSTFIMISGHGSIDTAVECLKLGAFDFIEKPLDLNRIMITIRNASEKSTLVEEKESLVKETKNLKKRVEKKYAIIGSSDAITQVKSIADRVAPTEARVLITGSNGTGKELIARRVHRNSERADKVFVEVNCAAIPSELIESELFGHEKGAFTSANKLRKGKFEQADGGTLFLDEIGDMSLSAQAKVLRALQESVISRVGGDKAIKVDVRVIAATNKDLKHEIAEGRFREDLYHRVGVIIIEIPSLDSRKDDIPILAEYFIESICTEYGKQPKKITPAALKMLQERSWSGNIREFRNVIERLIILSQEEITPDDVKLFGI